MKFWVSILIVFITASSLYSEEEISLRWLIKRDYPEMLEIEAKNEKHPWSEEKFLETMRENNCIGMVAVVDNKVVGYMIYELNDDHLRLLKFVPGPTDNHFSVAKAMTNRLLEKVHFNLGRGRSHISIGIDSEDTPLMEYLTDLGFVTTTIHRDYRGRADNYDMELRLPNIISKESFLSPSNQLRAMDFYQRLQIPEGATERMIRGAQVKLSAFWSPAFNPPDATEDLRYFSQREEKQVRTIIQDTVNLLLNPDKRASYDRERHTLKKLADAKSKPPEPKTEIKVSRPLKAKFLPKEKSYYDRLGIPRNASHSVLVDAYLDWLLHSDRFSQTDKTRIEKAFNVLLDKEKRGQYDRKRTHLDVWDLLPSDGPITLNKPNQDTELFDTRNPKPWSGNYLGDESEENFLPAKDWTSNDLDEEGGGLFEQESPHKENVALEKFLNQLSPKLSLSAFSEYSMGLLNDSQLALAPELFDRYLKTLKSKIMDSLEKDDPSTLQTDTYTDTLQILKRMKRLADEVPDLIFEEGESLIAKLRTRELQAQQTIKPQESVTPPKNHPKIVEKIGTIESKLEKIPRLSEYTLFPLPPLLGAGGYLLALKASTVFDWSLLQGINHFSERFPETVWGAGAMVILTGVRMLPVLSQQFQRKYYTSKLAKLRKKVLPEQIPSKSSFSDCDFSPLAH